uniref:Uncharacterized protein n=1 Tax=viral metagenome TaxID=1070528 RepID=A0A6M3L7A3_9ZZZZ
MDEVSLEDGKDYDDRYRQQRADGELLTDRIDIRHAIATPTHHHEHQTHKKVFLRIGLEIEHLPQKIREHPDASEYHQRPK